MADFVDVVVYVVSRSMQILLIYSSRSCRFLVLVAYLLMLLISVISGAAVESLHANGLLILSINLINRLSLYFPCCVCVKAWSRNEMVC